jgi:colicin import membrane protein
MRLSGEVIEKPAPGTDLAVISPVQAIVPRDFFKPGGSDDVLARLEIEVRKRAAELDISTEPGRKAIASLAYQVARSKTALDEQGKALVVGIKAQVGVIDKERAAVWDRCEKLQKEVRQPLTDWENAEKARVASHEAILDAIAASGRFALENWRTTSIEDIEARKQAILDGPRNWEEFSTRADKEKNAAIGCCLQAIEMRKSEDTAQAEKARLEAEARERAIKEREEAVAKAAKEEAERRAEEQARLAREAAERERQRVENERIEAEARAKQAEAARIAAIEKAEREAREAAERHQKELERQAREAEIAAERAAARERQAEEQRLADLREAELRRIKAAEEAKRRLEEAAEKAEIEKQRAVEAEKARAAAEERRKREEAEARERNKRHREKCHAEAVSALRSVGLDEIAATLAVKAIAAGSIPRVTLSY